MLRRADEPQRHRVSRFPQHDACVPQPARAAVFRVTVRAVDAHQHIVHVQHAVKTDEKVTIQVQALKGDNAPAALILLPEQMRRMNDMGALMEQRLPRLPDHHVLLVNRRHRLVEGLQKLSAGALVTGAGSSPTQELAEKLSRHLYEMAKLSVGGLEPNELAGFQQRSSDLMGQLMERGL